MVPSAVPQGVHGQCEWSRMRIFTHTFHKRVLAWYPSQHPPQETWATCITHFPTKQQRKSPEGSLHMLLGGWENPLRVVGWGGEKKKKTNHPTQVNYAIFYYCRRKVFTGNRKTHKLEE